VEGDRLWVVATGLTTYELEVSAGTWTAHTAPDTGALNGFVAATVVSGRVVLASEGGIDELAGGTWRSAFRVDRLSCNPKVAVVAGGTVADLCTVAVWRDRAGRWVSIDRPLCCSATFVSAGPVLFVLGRRAGSSAEPTPFFEVWRPPNA
jgi:hypothetical protein